VHSVNYPLITSIFALLMALGVIIIRIKASRKPTSVLKIVMPPIGMTTGFFMFVVPQTHIPLTYAFLAALVGALFSYPLISSSKMFVSNGEVYLKRSPGFIIVLLSLLLLRTLLHGYVEKFVSLPQTGAIFFVLAFGMLLPWRLTMLIQYQRLRKRVDEYDRTSEAYN
jgi:membrane protein CcdC involved in cytochrome C biogenesis